MGRVMGKRDGGCDEESDKGGIEGMLVRVILTHGLLLG